MNIIVMVDKSAGNDSVGNMWTETKIFKPEDTLQKIIDWASGNMPEEYLKFGLKETVRIQIAQENKE